MNYKDYLQTDYWKAVAFKVKERAEFRCVVCNSSEGLSAHHRTYDHRGNELSHLNDLTCLCGACHNLYHKQYPDKLAMPDMPEPPLSKREKKLLRKRRNHEAGLARHIIASVNRPRFNTFERTQDEVRAEVASMYDHDGDMPEAFPYRITDMFLRKLKTKAGGYTNRTLLAIGVSVPPVGGWPRTIMGRELTEEQCRTALRGRECKSTLKTLRRRAQPYDPNKCLDKSLNY